MDALGEMAVVVRGRDRDDSLWLTLTVSPSARCNITNVT
jgi:hypothetical protein